MRGVRRLRRRLSRWLREARLERSVGSGEPVPGTPDLADVVVSLTTTPLRLPRAHLAVESLLRQSRRPGRLVLWLSDALGEADLSPQLRRQRARGLELRFRPDLRSATKLLHALVEHPEHTIVTADDDTLYPRRWLEELWDSQRHAPGLVHCHRAHGMRCAPDGTLRSYYDWAWLSPGEQGPSPWLFPTGVGGVLYPPGALHPEVLDVQSFLRLCPTADDVWFKAMALLRGTSCRKVAAHGREFPSVRAMQGRRLGRENRRDGRHDAQIRAVFQRYDLMAQLRAMGGDEGGSRAS